MCIIIIKPKGVEVGNAFYHALTVAASYNRDGIGFSLKRAGTTTIHLLKGIYIEASFIKFITGLNILNDDEFLFHARIKTHGNISVQNCHPLIISKKRIDESDVHNCDIPVLAHNGIMSGYTGGNSFHSDTYLFVRDFLAENPVDKIVDDCISNVAIQRLIFGYNKIAIMFPNRDIVTFGEFIKDLDGCLFSNSCYKAYSPELNYEQVIKHYHKEYD